MRYGTLGRTGLRVSVAGLGCGGNSRLGLGVGKRPAEAVALVRAAVDLGVNFFDTAEVYATETVVGTALKDTARDSVVVSSKSRMLRDDGSRIDGVALLANLEASLRRLQMTYIDVYHLHAVQIEHYDFALQELVPVLERARRDGKIRHIGVTEMSPQDPEHTMLRLALADPCWEVIMLAFHLLNQAAHDLIFPTTQEQGVGTLLMFVVRNIFSRPGLLQATLQDLVAHGQLPEELAQQEEPLNFLIHPNGASSLMDAAYRFARHEPGCDVVLFGTSDEAHLRTNIESILKPPLPGADVALLRKLFAHLRGVGLDYPSGMTIGAAGR